MFRRVLAGAVLSFVCLSGFAMNQDPKEPDYYFLPNIKTDYLMMAEPEIASWYKNQALEIVRKTLNTSPSSPYRKVRIRMVYNAASIPEALIVALLSSQDKSFALVRINLTENFTVASVVGNYQLTQADLAQSPNYAFPYTPTCPDNRVQFVIGNNFKGDESVEKEVQAVYQASVKKGYRTFLMDVNDPQGPQPTVKAYEDWMSCPNVKGFYNESHGSTQLIVLSDDDFTYSLVEKDLTNYMKHDVVLFDSCSTFQDPLLSAMTDGKKGNSQKYMAGFVPLPFGASERTASCFWMAAMDKVPMTQQLIVGCALKSGLKPYAFRIKGNGSQYLRQADEN